MRHWCTSGPALRARAPDPIQRPDPGDGGDAPPAGVCGGAPSDFWESTKNTMIAAFKKQEFTHGICSAISEAGKQLACFFPLKENDKNEFPIKK